MYGSVFKIIHFVIYLIEWVFIFFFEGYECYEWMLWMNLHVKLIIS